MLLNIFWKSTDYIKLVGDNALRILKYKLVPKRNQTYTTTGTICQRGRKSFTNKFTNIQNFQMDSIVNNKCATF